MDGPCKVAFLKGLRDDPEMIARWIASNLTKWAMAAIVEIENDGFIINNLQAESVTLANYFKQFFEKEITGDHRFYRVIVE